MTKLEWMEKNAFDSDGLTWCVFGEDTFSIKDELKKLGCKFSPVLKWHAGVPLEVPIGYGMFSIEFNEVLEWNEEQGMAYFLPDAQEKMDKKFAELQGPSLSEFVGTVGERLRNLTVKLKSAVGFDGNYGWTNIYKFLYGDNELVWMTSKELEFEKGDILDLTGTVKKQEEFRGVRTTQLSRCIIKKIGE